MEREGVNSCGKKHPLLCDLGQVFEFLNLAWFHVEAGGGTIYARYTNASFNQE